MIGYSQKRRLKMTTLSQLMPIDTLREDYENGFVREVTHDTNPNLHILCYTPITQYARHWNDVTRKSRGLCVEYPGSLKEHTVTDANLANARVVSRGIPKFFTVDTIANSLTDSDNVILSLEDDDEMVAQLQGIEVKGSAPTFVADKLDGAMCVGYIDDNQFHVHTKGSFHSDEAVIGNEILKRYDTKGIVNWLAKNELDMTPVFEVITPKVPHIVNYEQTEDLFFLGFVDNSTGRWQPALPTDEFPNMFGFKTPEILNASTLETALALPPRDNREGVVLTVETTDAQRMLKVKYEAFLNLQRLRTAAKATVDTVLPQLVLKNITNNEALEKLDNTDLYNLCGIESNLRSQMDITTLRRIMHITIVPLFDTAIEIRKRFDKILPVIESAYTTANVNGGDNVAYVQYTLNNVEPSLRPYVFAAKKSYLNKNREQIPIDLANQLIKEWHKSHKDA